MLPGKPRGATSDRDLLLERIGRLEEELRQRKDRVSELDFDERAQERLTKWAKSRFWVIALFGLTVIATTGYGLLQAILSAAKEKTVAAELAATNATTAVGSINAKLLEVQTTVANIETRFKSQEKKLNTRSADIEQKLNIKAKALDDKLQPFEQRHAELSGRVVSAGEDMARLETRSAAVATAVQKMEGADQKLKDIQNKLANLYQDLDKSDILLRYFYARAGDTSLTSSERTNALVALSMWPGRTDHYFDEIKQLFLEKIEQHFETISSFEEKQLTAVALATGLLRSNRSKGLTVLSDYLVTKSDKSHQCGVIARALRVSNSNKWDVETLKWAIRGFEGKEDFFSSEVAEYNTFASAEARDIALKYLLKQLEDKSHSYHAVTVMRWSITDDDKKTILPQLKALQAKNTLEASSKSYIDDIIKEAEKKNPK